MRNHTAFKVSFIYQRLLIAAAIFIFLSSPSKTFALNEASQTFTLDGQLFQTGTKVPLLDAAVKIKIQIMNPNGTCLLYEEQQTTSTLTTDGRFTIHVGSALGSSKRTVNDSGRTMNQIFQNMSSIFANSMPGQTCSGGFYTPSPGDVRYFRVTVIPSTTNAPDILTPDLVIDSIPSAVVAQSVQGLERANILQTSVSASTALTQANLEALFTTPAYTNLQAILGGNFMKTDSSGASLPSYASDPAGVSTGDIWFDTTTNEIKYKTAGGVQSVGSSGSGISSLTVGSSLSVNGVVAGTISGSGTIDLSNTGVGAGTYTKVMVDTKGRVTAGTVSLVEGDIPNLTTPGKVSGNTITSGTISGSAGINTSGNLITTGTVSGLTVQATNLRVYNGANYVQLAAPALGGNVNLTLPATDGNPNEFLKTDGNGVLSWGLATITSSDVTTALGYSPLNAATPFSGDVSGLSNATSVDKIKGKSVTAATISGQIMIYDGTAWVNSVVSGDATLAYDGTLSLNKVPIAKGGTNATSFGNNRIIASNGSGSALVDFSCSLNQVISFDGTGQAVCASVSAISGAILNGGNSTGADISVGTNDNKALNFKTNNTVAMTISQNGFVGIGDSNPGAFLQVGPSATGSSSIVFNKDSNANGGSFVLNDINSGPGRYYDMFFRTQGTNRARLVAGQDSSGNAYFSIGVGAASTNRLLIDNNGYVGISISSPSSALDINGALTAQGMSSAPAVSPANAGRIYYDYSTNKFKVSQNGSAYTDLVSSGTGTGGIISLGGQAGAAQALAISVDNSVTTPTITSASDTHTWKIPMASNAGTTAGLLNKTDYDSFVAKLGASTIFAGDVSGAYNSTVVQKIQGKSVTAASVSGQIMIYDGTAWVNNVMSGDATLAHNGMFTLNKVPVTKGGTNATTFGNNRIIASNGTGSALVDFTCPLNQVITFDASGNSACANVSSLITALVNGGNTTGADISAGTNDNKALKFKTNNTIAMTISQNGNVGIGTQAPSAVLDVVANYTAGRFETTQNGSNAPAMFIATGAGGSFGAIPYVQLHNSIGSNNSGMGLIFTGKDNHPATAKVAGIEGRMTNNASNNHNGVLIFGTALNGSLDERMRISETGNVGIGLTNPTTALDISGAITAQGVSSAPAVSPSNTGRIYFDYATNKFKVSQNGSAYTDLVPTSQIVNGGNTTGADISIGTNDNKALKFKVNNSVAMTISQNGYVGIGTTAPAGIFDVRGGTVGSGNGNDINLIAQSATAGGSNGGNINITAGNGTNSGGAVTITGGSYGFGSASIIVGGGQWVSNDISITAGNNDSNGGPGNVSIGSGASGNNGGGYLHLTTGSGYNAYSGSIFIAPGPAGALGTGNIALGVTPSGVARGNIGVGVSTPTAKLEVQGQVVSKVYNNAASTTFNFANGNAQYTSASCGAMTLQNMVDGGSYTIAVQGGTSGTCTFTDSAGGRTFKFSPTNAATTAGTHTIYSMQVMGSYVYVSWISGF